MYARAYRDDKKEEKRCYNCGDKNHLSAACPTKERGVKCFKCDEYGHIAANCVKATDKKTKKDCEMLRNSGLENVIKMLK